MSRAKSYSDEFKSDAVKLANEQGVKRAADSLGIAPSTLHGWHKKSLGQKKDIHKNQVQEELSYNDLLKRLKNTEKELRYANEINKVLKKSLGIMAQEHPETLKR